MTKKTVYKQNLMHIQPVGACFFVTFRLHGSLPKALSDKLKIDYKRDVFKLSTIDNPIIRNSLLFDFRKKHFLQIDQVLDRSKDMDHCNLTETAIAAIIKEQLHRFDDTYYELLSYCIMPNHVHMVIDTSIQISDEKAISENWNGYKQLDEIMKRIKGASSRYINQNLNRSGKLWQTESYDIYIRNDQMLVNVISYVLENPVKAKLSAKWEDYAHSYLLK